MELFWTVPAYFITIYFFYNYWDLSIIVKTPFKNCQDDIK